MKKLLLIAAAIFSVYVTLCLAVWFAEPSAFSHGDEPPSVWNAFWFGLVTITTVGYGDLSPHGAAGKLITVLLFMFSIGIFSFLITKIQSIVAERQQLRALGMYGTDFKNHVVVCSFSRISIVAIKELLAAGRQVAVVVERADNIPLVQELGNKQNIFATVGDPTSEEALNRVAISRANTVVAASDDDTLNMIVALEIRRLNPRARVVVSTKRAELRNTLTATGVTYVASPFELSGRLVASAAFEPDVARLVDDITSGADDDDEGPDGGFDLQQFSVPPNSNMVNASVAQINATLKQIQGPLLIAVSKHVGNGEYKIYPHPADNLVLYQYDSLIVLGNKSQTQRVEQMLGVVQGR